MRALFVALAVLSCCAGAALAQAPKSRSAFRDAVIARILHLQPDARVESRGDLSFQVTGATDVTVNLDNAYQRYLADPERLDSVVDRFARFALTPQAAPGGERARLVVILRPRAYLDEIPPGAADARPIWRPFAGDLVQILALDSADVIEIPPSSAIAAIGVTTEEAWRLAGANLNARMGPLQVGAMQGYEQVVYVGADSGLAPSLLADAATCGADETGDGLYLLLSRDAFVRADRRLPGAEAAFFRLVRDVASSRQAFSETPITCRAGAWEVARPSH